jgi:flagellar biosynthetic protein FlhB
MADKTEAPTQKRLEEARSEGNIVRSQELNAAAIMLVAALLVGGPGKDLALGFKDLVVSALAELPRAQLSQSWLQQAGLSYAARLAAPFLTILVGLLAAGVAVTLAQTRFLWSSKNLGFKFNRLNPLNGLKRIFSGRGLVELLKSLLKIGVIGWVSYSFLMSHASEISGLVQVDLKTGVGKFFELGLALMLQVGEVYLVLAAADYAYQRFTLMRSLRMSKEEVKEEYKRSEGDPALKSRIRSQMRRLARQRMMSAVPKATVVVTNPTHLAIAIQYEEGMHAPKVLAKGAALVAERIKAIARENHIPLVENVAVARAIYKAVDIDQEISPDLYTAMAEILAYVFQLKKGIQVPYRAAGEG